MKCKKHKAYKAKHYPNAECLECWQAFANSLADRINRLLEEREIAIIAMNHLKPECPHCGSKDCDEVPEIKYKRLRNENT
jgi:hypothetical protein